MNYEKNKCLLKTNSSFSFPKRFSNRSFFSKLENLKYFPALKNAELPFSLTSSGHLNIKTSIYILLKILKGYQRTNISFYNDFSLKALNDFSFKLQTSGFYTSVLESQRKKKLEEIRMQILKFYTFSILKQYNRNNIVIDCSILNENYSPKKGYKNFYDNLKISKLTNRIKRSKAYQKSYSFSVLQKKYTKILESRLFLYLKAHKKKYKIIFKNLNLNRLKIKQLFNLFSKTKKKFVKEKKNFFLQYKRLTWKRKKQRDRKKIGIFYFLRKRRRTLYNYYIPRHLEINYKTFDFIHLGKFDLSTTNSKITFWLNLRRLLTFVSL